MKSKKDKVFIPGYGEELEDCDKPATLRCESCGALNDSDAEYCCDCGCIFDPDDDDEADAADEDDYDEEEDEWDGSLDAVFYESIDEDEEEEDGEENDEYTR